MIETPPKGRSKNQREFCKKSDRPAPPEDRRPPPGRRLCHAGPRRPLRRRRPPPRRPSQRHRRRRVGSLAELGTFGIFEFVQG